METCRNVIQDMIRVIFLVPQPTGEQIPMYGIASIIDFPLSFVYIT